MNVRRRSAVLAWGSCTALSSLVAMSTVASATTCATVAACLFGQNTGTGTAVQGISAGNHGIYGTTSVAATQASSGRAGVFGKDATSNTKQTFDYGVLGQSTNGVGTGGTSITNVGISGTSAANYGVLGTSSANNGVTGRTTYAGTVSHSTAGVVGYDQSTNANAYNKGVLGFSPSGTGVVGESNRGGGVVGTGYTSGVLGASYGGSGVVAESTLGDGLVATTNVGYNYGTSAAVHAFALRNSFPPNPNVFVGSADNTGSMNDVVSIDTYGNMILAGSLTQSGTPLVRTAGAHGAAVVSFGARTSAPTIEDMGEARLVDGHAFVRLDAPYADTIDTAARYLVLVSPQSDSKGLYVDRIGPTGFDVRENGAGRSTLTFDYRIAAKPRDTAAMRLPAADTLAHLGATRNVPHVAPITSPPRAP